MPTLFTAYIKEKWLHSGFQRYLRNTGWMFFGKIGSLIISFIATAYIARNLGPNNYGQLSYAVSFVSIFSFIAVLGIDQVLYRDLVRYPNQKNLYMGSAFVLRMLASTSAVALCLIFALFLSPKDVSFYLIIILSMSFIFSSFQIINYEFQANVESKLPSILSFCIVIVLNILKIIVITLNKGVIYLALILLLESFFYAAGYLYYRKKKYGSITAWKFDKRIMLNILSDSWPLIFTSAFALIYENRPNYSENIISTESVGLYDAAVRLSEVWYFIPTMIVSSILPAVINAKKTSNALYYSRIKKLLIFLFTASFLTALFTYIAAPLLVDIVFGSKFFDAIPILRIYIWSNIATSLNLFALNYLIIEGRRKILFISSLTGMLVNIALNIYLIPIYGTLGAAYATLVSYSILFLFIFLVPDFRRTLIKAC